MYADQAEFFQLLEDKKPTLNNHDLNQNVCRNTIINVTDAVCDNFTLTKILKRNVCTEQNSMKRDSLFIKKYIL